MENLILKLVPALVLGSTFAMASCADPTLAVDFYIGFSPSRTVHPLRQHFVFVGADATGSDFQLQGKMFQAWATTQEFTVPLWQLNTPDNEDLIVLPSTSSSGDAPVVSGFNALAIIAFVYPTQTCGSVPLLGAQLATETDHYYTIDPVEHSGLLSLGWTDAGVAGFVLPLTSD